MLFFLSLSFCPYFCQVS